jgi:hypothetical protein
VQVLKRPESIAAKAFEQVATEKNLCKKIWRNETSYLPLHPGLEMRRRGGQF